MASRGLLPPSGRPPAMGMRLASPRNNSAMLAASMNLGGTPRGVASRIPVQAQASAPDLSSLSSLDSAVENEGDRLRKKRLAIFTSKYEVDAKIVNRNKALVNLVKVCPPRRSPLPRPQLSPVCHGTRSVCAATNPHTALVRFCDRPHRESRRSMTHSDSRDTNVRCPDCMLSGLNVETCQTPLKTSLPQNHRKPGIDDFCM